MDINKMTAAEALDYLRKDVFGSMGIDIDSVLTLVKTRGSGLR